MNARASVSNPSHASDSRPGRIVRHLPPARNVATWCVPTTGPWCCICSVPLCRRSLDRLADQRERHRVYADDILGLVHPRQRRLDPNAGLPSPAPAQGRQSPPRAPSPPRAHPRTSPSSRHRSSGPPRISDCATSHATRSSPASASLPTLLAALHLAPVVPAPLDWTDAASPADCVAPRSNTPNVPSRRALPRGSLAALPATRHFFMDS